MFRFPIRDVMWLMVVVGLAIEPFGVSRQFVAAKLGTLRLCLSAR
jgi:hypothetical protein